MAVFDCAAVESNAFVGVEDGALPVHGFEASHAAQGVLDLHLTDGLVGVSLNLLEEFALGGYTFSEGGFEIGFGGCVGAGGGMVGEGEVGELGEMSV